VVGIETLERIFTSNVAMPLVLALIILWQERRIRNKDRRIEGLYDRIINLLELRIAAFTGKDPK